MKSHWPLGRCNHGLAYSMTRVCAATAIVCLVALSTVSLKCPWIRIDALLIPWALALFVLAAMQRSALAVYDPAVLKQILPTPLEGEGLLKHVDPFASVGMRAVPYLIGFVVAFQQAGALGPTRPLEGVLLVAATIAVLRAALPAIQALGVALRVVLVPFGHLLVVTVSIGALVHVTAAALGASDESVPIAAASWPAVQWHALLGIIVASSLAHSHIRAWSRRRVLGMLDRETLIDYVMPISSARSHAPHKMILEFFGSKRMRRVALLVQEALGINRPLLAGLLAVVYAVLFVSFAAEYGHNTGAAAPILISVGTVTFAVMALGTIHLVRARMKSWSMHFMFSHAVPIGARESDMAQVGILATVYLLGALLGTLVALARPSVATAHNLGICLTNVFQILILLVLLPATSIALGAIRPWPLLARAVVALTCIFMQVGLALVTFAAASHAAKNDLWVCVVPSGLRLAWKLVERELMFVPPDWTFHLAAWVVPASLLVPAVVGWRRATEGAAIGSRSRAALMVLQAQKHIAARQSGGAR